jgi:hypothetical protein
MKGSCCGVHLNRELKNSLFSTLKKSLREIAANALLTIK